MVAAGIQNADTQKNWKIINNLSNLTNSSILYYVSEIIYFISIFIDICYISKIVYFISIYYISKVRHYISKYPLINILCTYLYLLYKYN